MNATDLLLLALDPARLLQAQGLTADPWQREFLVSPARNILLNCCRGAGKSRITSALALHTALFRPNSLTLLVSRSLRQSSELFRYVKQNYSSLDHPMKALKQSQTQLELVNGRRIVSLPGKEETIRSFQGVHLLVLDEAARIPDTLYASVSPMTGVSKGRTICLSTPYGQRGFFWREWYNDRAPWARFRIPWQSCPRLTAEYIAEETRKFGDSWVAQEFGCSFTALTGLVYPNFEVCYTDLWTPAGPGQQVGGIDWGWRNPFAALWGQFDRDDVLWIRDERYLRTTPLHQHAAALPRRVMWYADPAGRTEIEEFRAAGHKVRAAVNDIRAGIAAVKARLESGRLKVDPRRCPNLCQEAKLYHYPDRQEDSENPVDEDNHALAALRYLISGLDHRFMAKLRRQPPGEPEASATGAPDPSPQPPEPQRRYLAIDNDDLFEKLD